MEKLASLLRYMQFYGHIAHNLTSGETFFQDHAFFADLYNAYEAHYDDVVERSIGLGMSIDLFKAHNSACQLLSKNQFTDACSAIDKLQEAERVLCSTINTELEDKTEGTKQLLGEIMNQSEMRQYKMQQRVKK